MARATAMAAMSASSSAAPPGRICSTAAFIMPSFSPPTRPAASSSPAPARSAPRTVRPRLADGSCLTAVELQLLILQEARHFADRGGCAGVVPEAAQILQLWEDTLTKLKNSDFAALSRRLDWVLKLTLLETVRARRGF